MNGRVQDPRLGRFISADPFVQAPYLTQSHNRFAYVMNNPASLVDPSGFWWQNQLSPELYYPGHDVHMAAVNADYKAVPVFAPNPNAGSFDGPNNGGGNVVVGWDLVPDEQPFLDDTELQKQAEILRLQLEFGIVTIPWYNEAGAGLGVATNMRLPVPRTGLAVELYPRGWVPQSGSTSTLFIQDATGKTHLRLDRGYNIRTGQIDVHWNQRGTYDLFGIRNHTSVRGGSALYFGARGLRALGRGSLIGATATDVYAIATAEDKSREVVRAAGGWAGAMAGAKLLGSGGALLGSAEPGGGTIAGALAGGVVGGVVGYFGGEEAALAIYGWFTSE